MFDFNPQRPDPKLTELLAEYPVALFNERLFQSIELADRYCLELSIDLLQRLEVASQLEAWCSVPSLLQRLDFHLCFSKPLTWLLERLVAARLLAVQEQDKVRFYRSSGKWPRPKLAALRRLGLTIDPANAATLDLIDAAAAAYPILAEGAASDKEALLGKDNISLWLAYFHNHNPLYAVNNWVSAIAAVTHLVEKPKLRILEVGAGAGSGTEALLNSLAERHLLDRLEHYVMTELSPFFRRRGERVLRNKYRDLPLEFRALDINRRWDDQGVARADFDLVYGVNTLHIADDLVFSLKEAHASLAPAGWLVAGECLRPFPGQPIYIELVFQILDSFVHVKTDPDLRPDAGFLAPEHWRRSLTNAGFAEIRVTPDQEQIRNIYPRLFIGAVCGYKSCGHC